MKDFKLQDYSFKEKPFLDFFKRVLDILISVFALVALSWLFIIIAVVIKIHDRGSVFFRHKRVGKNGKDIYILKFRSMVPDADNLIKEFNEEQMKEYKENFKIKKDPRVTKVGRFLRKTSLDELPQFVNLLKGDITLVGPRPVMEEETQLYGEHRELLLKVKPGITGIWATIGRGQVNYQQRIDMELYYVCKRNAIMDVKLFLKTIVAVFKQEGAE